MNRKTDPRAAKAPNFFEVVRSCSFSETKRRTVSKFIHGIKQGALLQLVYKSIQLSPSGRHPNQTGLFPNIIMM